MKRILTGLAALVLTAGMLTGCGSNSDSSGNSENQNSSRTDSGVVEDLEDTGKNVVTDAGDVAEDIVTGAGDVVEDIVTGAEDILDDVTGDGAGDRSDRGTTTNSEKENNKQTTAD